MKLSSWKMRLLSGMICFCMIFQSMTFTASAEEGNVETQNIEIHEVAEETEAENIFVSEEEMTELTEESDEEIEILEEIEIAEEIEILDETDISEEVEVEESDDVEIKTHEEVVLAGMPTYGTLSNVNMLNSGFGVQITGGTYTYDLTAVEGYCYLYLTCFDENDNRQSMQYVYGMNGGTASTITMYNSSYTVHADTSYVRLELCKSAAVVENILESYEKFEVNGHPDIDMSLASHTPGSGIYTVKVGYTGDLNNVFGYSTYGQSIILELSYGTSLDESTWKKTTGWLNYSQEKEASVVFSGFESDTQYYGRLRAMIEFNDNMSYTNITVWEQNLGIVAFTTNKNDTYNLKNVFPDQVLRDAVLSALQRYDNTLTEDSDVTTSLFEKINSLHLARNKVSQDPVYDLTGIDLLTGLTSLTIKNHEVSYINHINWKALQQLNYLNLEGNNLTVLPDLSKNKALTSVRFDSNMISVEEFAKAKELLPASVSLYSTIITSQRVDGYRLIYDVDNYIYGNNVPLTMKVVGVRAGMGYNIKTFIDGEEASVSIYNGTPMELYTANSGLEEGAHTIRLEIYADGVFQGGTEDYTFNIVKEPIFIKNNCLYIENSSSSSSVYAQVYFDQYPSVRSMSIVGKDGTVYAESSYVNRNYTTSDFRYKIITNASHRTLYYVYGNMNLRYNSIPVGDHDLVITYTDGTTECLQDKVKVVAENESAINECYLDSNYDNGGEYIHLNIQAVNLDPAKLEYSLSQYGVNYPVKYVDCKKTYNGYSVKLKKDGWTDFIASDYVEFTITPKNGYVLLNGSYKYSSYISANVYYCNYNVVAGVLEVAFSDALNAEGNMATVEIREGSNTTDPVIAKASYVVTNGVAYFELKNADGTEFIPEAQTSYYAVVKVKDKTAQGSFYPNYSNSSRSYNYWNIPTIVKGVEESYAYYYTDIPYGEKPDEKEFSVSIYNDTTTLSNTAKQIWIYESNGYVVVGIKCNAADLAVGTYGFELYRNGRLFSMFDGQLSVVDTDKFVMTGTPYLSWKSDSEMMAYIYTPFSRENDDYEVVLVDYSGNVVDGLTTTVTERYVGSLMLSISGMEYANAQKSYNVKVLHKTLGKPITLKGSDYYSDENGEKVQIYATSTAYTYKPNDRVLGISRGGAVLPLTVTVYKSHALEVVEELILGESDFVNDTHYFTQEFYNSLPKNDASYDLIMIDAKGNFSFVTKMVLGISQEETPKEEWSYEVDKTTLYLNKTDEKKAEVIVSDYEESPSYSSSNTKVVTVKKDSTDAGKAVITAVGTGVAEITITADGISKTFTVTVTKVAESIAFEKTALSLNPEDEAEVIVQVLPAEAAGDVANVTYAANDYGVVFPTKTEEGVLLRALAPGKTTVIAALEVDGTWIRANCEVNVWDVAVDAEMNEGIIPLFINIEDAKSTTIEVLGSTINKPIFKSANTGIVTVTAVAGDPASAVLTAVGIGETQITVTVDGITKTFNVSVDRKFVVEGIVLSADALTMMEDTEETVNISMMPAEVQESIEEFEFNAESSDAEVVSAYVDENKNVVLAAHQKGNATVTISVMVDGEEYTATCEVEVVGVFDEETKLAKTEAEKKFVLLNAYPKNAAALKDIILSDGWKWLDGTIKLEADNAAPIQYYTAVYEEEGYQPFTALIPIAVTKLTGIAVEGSATLLSETTDGYDIVYKYTGYQPQEEDAHGFDEHYTITWTASGSAPLVTVEETDTTLVNITAANVASNKTQSVNVVLTVDEDSKKTFKTTLKLTVLAKPYVDEILVEEAETQEATMVTYSYDADAQILYIDLDDISTVKNAVTNTISLSAIAKALDIDSEIKMKWTSSDSGVATVKASADGKSAVITVKKAGSTVVKVTAQDAGKYEEEVLVVVKDYKPILESTSTTVNAYSTEGSAFVIREQNGNAVVSVELLENGAASEKACIEMSDNGYIVKAVENSGITKKTTIKPVLRITTENGETYDQVITVVIDVKKPTASLSIKDKANLFLTDAEAIYKITSKDVIASVQDITVADGYRLGLAEVDLENGLLTFNTKAEWSPDIISTYAANPAKPITNVVLKVTFAGYTEDAAQTIKLSIGTTTTKPSLKLNDITFVPGVTDGVVQVIDTKTKGVYQLTDENIIVTSHNSKNGNVVAEKTDAGVSLTYDGSSTVTYKATLSSERWTQDLVLSGKINVVKQQDLVLDSTKVTLNTATSVQKNGLTAIGVSVKNHGAAVEGITFETDKSSATLINSGYLYVNFDADTQQILIGLNQNKRGNIKTGTYKLTLNGTIWVSGQSVSLKKTTISITLTDKTPTVTLSAKGSIDLVQRDATSILYTPKLTNVTAQVADVRLAGTHAEYFKAQVENGLVKISAADAPMSTKISYSVDVVLVLDNGMTITKNVKIKPVSKNPKVTAGLTKGILFKSSGNSATFGLASGVNTAEIERVTMVTDKNTKYFDFVFENDKVTISLSDEAAKLKPGNYTISYKVYFKGAAYNASPVTMKFTATVK